VRAESSGHAGEERAETVDRWTLISGQPDTDADGPKWIREDVVRGSPTADSQSEHDCDNIIV
jgi:hypothetical protein